MSKQILKLIECGILGWSPNKRRILLAQGMQRRSNGAKILHKATIETRKAKKATHLLQIGWLWPSLNSINLGLINMNTLIRNYKTQENELINTKKAFLHISIETLFSKSLQNSADMGDMLFDRFAKHKNVIKVDHNKYTNLRAKDMIHEAHKSARCFREAHRHD